MKHTTPLEQAHEALQESRKKLSWFVESYPTDLAVSEAEFFANIDAAIASTAGQPAQQQEPVAGWDFIEKMAAERYKVGPSHNSMFYRHAVVAGNGTQQLYLGRELECENMARRFAGAFLDGAFVMQSRTSTQAQRKIPQNCGTGYCSCIECLKEPAAQQQEPVAKVDYKQRDSFRWLNYLGWQRIPDGASLYTSTPAQRKPLTDEQIDEVYYKSALEIKRQYNQLYSFVRAIEAAHGITGE